MAVIPCTSAVILLAAAPLLLQVPPPRDTPPPPPPPPVGTSRISGQVVAADTGAAVKRASVMISGRPAPGTGRGAPGVAGRGAVQLSIVTGGAAGSHPPQMTDDGGRFEFPDIPGGIYSIMVQPRHGYVRPQ